MALMRLLKGPAADWLKGGTKLAYDINSTSDWTNQLPISTFNGRNVVKYASVS